MLKNKNLLDALNSAISGLAFLMREKAAKREIALFIICLVIAFWRQTQVSFFTLAFCLLLMSIEALNTAIESLCDYINLKQHPAIKKIKDLGAAAVLIIFIATVFLIIGTIFWV